MPPSELNSPYNAAIMARPTSKRGTDFGLRLAEARKAAGLTQAQLAEQLDVSQQMIDYYERRARNPSADFVRRAAALLNVTADVLLGTPAPRVKRGPPSEWEKRIDAIRELPRDKQREIQNVVDALIAKAS
jgi:transcriptional regulator with XRE-family HTH domain